VFFFFIFPEETASKQAALLLPTLAMFTTVLTVTSFAVQRAAPRTQLCRLRGGAAEALAPGRPTLTLAAADTMADAALRECESRGFKDISVFVVDASGRTLVSKTMIGAPPLIPTIAEAKAGAAIGTHSSSRALKDKYVPERTPQLMAMTTLSATTHRPFAAVPGGVLCRDAASGLVVGAVGVSGASADEDEHCALVGAQACGFATEPATSALGDL